MGCFVYVIQMSDQDIVKVGISKNPDSRIASLRTASPFQLRFVELFELPTEADARAIESAVHDDLDCFHMGGEWFRCDPTGAMGSVQGEIVLRFHETQRLDVAADIFRRRGLSDAHIADVFAANIVPEGVA